MDNEKEEKEKKQMVKKLTKKYLLFLVNNKMQSKTPKAYHLTDITMEKL